MPEGKRKPVEVVVRGLDLGTFDDLVAESQEDVFDLAPDLRDQMQVATRRPLAGQRDVDDLLGDATVELGALELGLAASDGLLEGRPHRVQRHAGLAIADVTKRQLERALAAEVANANGLELVERRGSGDRGQGLAFQRLCIHRADSSEGPEARSETRHTVLSCCAFAPRRGAIPRWVFSCIAYHGLAVAP